MSGLLVKAGGLLVKGLGFATACDCCGEAGGACCGVANDAGCDVLTKQACADAGGWWFQGEGVPCVSNCPPPHPSLAVTLTGAKVNPTFGYQGQVAASVAAINQTFSLPIPCSAGRPQCPGASDWGPVRMGRHLTTVMWQAAGGEAGGFEVCFSCYARANCSVYLARVSVCLSGFATDAAPVGGDRASSGIQYAEWLLGYTEDPDTGLDNTPMGGCAKVGDTAGGPPDYAGTSTGGPNVAPWELSDMRLALRYV